MSRGFKHTYRTSIPQIKALIRDTPPTSLIFQVIRDYKKRHTQAKLRSSGLLLLQKLFDESMQTNVWLFAAFGTLLGIIREGGIISHDYDLDTAFIYRGQSDWNKIDEIFNKAGFHFLKEFSYQGITTERTYTLNGISIDVFAFIPYQSNQFRAYLYYRDKTRSYANHEFSVAYVDFPDPGQLIRRTVQDDIVLIVPSEYETLLQVTYGSAWAVPDPGYNHFDYWKPIDRASGISTIL